jgi:hypothetical protein
LVHPFERRGAVQPAPQLVFVFDGAQIKVYLEEEERRQSDGYFRMTTCSNKMVETSILSDIGYTFPALPA